MNELGKLLRGRRARGLPYPAANLRRRPTDNVANALAACEGVTVPIAEWRVHATSAIIYKAVGDDRRAREHSRLGATVRQRLADSLPKDHPARLKFKHRSELISTA